jgi:pyroglutamyl-peptidase
MARPRILFTGFGPFPGVADNPSAWLAETLAGKPPSPACEFHARILPTEWDSAALAPRLYDRLQPHVMIHFGVSQRARSFHVERIAHNRAAPRADAKGARPQHPVIRPGGPDRLETDLPAAAVAAHLRSHGLGAVTSRSAGRYLCNFLYYHSLDWARRQADPRSVLFVHIPPLSAGGNAFSRKDLLRGAHEILRFVLAVARFQEKPAIGPALARGEATLSAKDA